jgi:hypothetical protein
LPKFWSEEYQRRLDEAVGVGGKPVGLIAVDRDPKTGGDHCLTRSYPEYPEPAASRILRAVAESFRRSPSQG